MNLRFSWAEFNGRAYPGCESLDGAAHDNLLSLLMDDGGCGLDHHIRLLADCVAICRDVLHGSCEHYCFTTELFSASNQTLVAPSAVSAENGDCYQTDVFARIIDDWVSYLGRGVPSGPEVRGYA